MISTDQSLTLATGNGQVLIDPNNVKVGPLTATGMATAKGTETTDSHHLVVLSGDPEVANCLPASLYHHGTVVNQDVDSNHLVISRIETEADNVVGQVTKGAE